MAADALPENLEAEERVLGAALLDVRAIESCADVLTAVDFSRERHALIWQACVDLHANGDAVDPVLVADRLEAQGDLERVGGPAKLVEIVAVTPAAGNAVHYATIVREHSVRRNLIRVGSTIADSARGRTGTGPEMVEEAERLVFDLAQERARGDFVTGAEVAQELVSRMVELSQATTDVIGLPTGFSTLDKLTSGLHPGNLIVLAARPSMGKSGLAFCITMNVIRSKQPVALFTLEMSRWEVMQRMLAIDALVDGTHIRSPSRLSSEHWSRVMDSSARIADMPLFIEDTGAVTITEIRSKARRLKLRHPDLALIVVDYIQLMSGDGRADSRQNEVAQISRALKRLAQELEVPVLALSQLSRQVEGRHDKRPLLSDLRESGAIEQDADVVMMLYRDEYYFPEEDDNKGVAEINIAKHRNGPTAMRKLAFVSKFARFSDMAHDEGQPESQRYGDGQ